MKGFATSNFFVLRTPLFPLEEFLALAKGVTFAQTLRDGDLPAAVAADHKMIRARLTEFVDRPEVKEALWLAAPEFFESLSLWRKEPDSAKGQKLERSLYRYIARMTSRPTPFGLFAGCSLGRIGAQTRLQTGARTEYWRRSRLDMEYLFNLAEKLSFDLSLQSQLTFRPNTSLYLAAGRYHHAQSYLSHDVRCYRLIATEPTSYLAATLDRATAGATPADLASALVKDDGEISIEEAAEYIRRLIESQVLVPDLAPPVTGPEPIENMIRELESVGETTVSGALRAISERLQTLDQCGLGNELVHYLGLVEEVSRLPVEFKMDHLVQVDMMKAAADVTMDQPLIRDILRGVEVLHSLARTSQPDPFSRFKEDFRERYQDQEVPLVLALDDDVGIGFERQDQPDAAPEPLLENIDLSAAPEEAVVKARTPDLVLLRKLEELAREKKTTLELDAKLLEALRAKNPLPLPAAFAVMVQIIGPVTGKQDRNQDRNKDKLCFFLQGLTGPSGAQLLGRFCPADVQLTACVNRHLREEEENGATGQAVYAEIAHLPEGRIGNVLYRPRLRNYEIPFLANSRAPLEHQIPISDLMVSIRNDRVFLRSQRLRCEVIPRLTSAHGYAHARNLKLYKFLCLLQTQGVSTNLSWNWGILEEAAFLPQVCLGHIVLAPARWRLGKEEIEMLSGKQGTEQGKRDQGGRESARINADNEKIAKDAGEKIPPAGRAERLRKMDEWRRKKGIPRFVLLAESDNQLLIDFENVLSMETLIEYIKNRPRAHLLEMLQEPQSLYAGGPEGGFTHELVIPFIRTKTAEIAGTQNPIHTSAGVATKTQRNFLPCSEWLFAKIYASPSQLDRLLLAEIKPLVAKSLATGAADHWFFIRYGDPHWHLRVRWHGNPEMLIARVLPELSARMEAQRRQGKVWRMQLDTYERELERYGGPVGMSIAERLFQHDSDLALELLAAISEQPDGKIRWQLAVAGVHRLLRGLGLDLSARRDLLNDMRKMQEEKFGVQQAYRQQISDKFRKERQTLESLLETIDNNVRVPAPAQSALELFSGQIETIRSELENAEHAGKLSKTIPELSASYVHMHLNRLFRSAANAQEMVLYDFLARTYDSIMARRILNGSGT